MITINLQKQKTTHGKSPRGQVLLECILTLGIFLLSLAFILEVIRKGERHSLFHYLCFLHNREFFLGNSKEESLTNQRNWLRSVLPEKEASLIVKNNHFQSACLNKGLKTTFQYRYQGFFKFLNPQERFRISTSCTFSFL